MINLIFNGCGANIFKFKTLKKIPKLRFSIVRALESFKCYTIFSYHHHIGLSNNKVSVLVIKGMKVEKEAITNEQRG